MAKAQLSVLLEELSGKAGSAVFVHTRQGTLVRARAVANQPDTPAQIAARQRMSIAAQAYKTLPTECVQAWQAYAEAHHPHQTANTTFIALTTKWLQIQAYINESNPKTPTPTQHQKPKTEEPKTEESPTPPSPNAQSPTPKTEEPQSRNAVKPTPTNRGIEESIIEESPLSSPNAQNPTPKTEPPQSPPATPFPGDSLAFTVQNRNGQIQVRADRANLPDTLTEILLQRLPSRNRKPEPTHYATNRFTNFSPNTIQIPVSPGTYAVAIRYARPTTGQSTPLTPIATITV